MNTNQYIQRQQLGYTQFMAGKPQKAIYRVAQNICNYQIIKKYIKSY